jgi:hypothetical protein
MAPAHRHAVVSSEQNEAVAIAGQIARSGILEL